MARRFRDKVTGLTATVRLNTERPYLTALPQALSCQDGYWSWRAHTSIQSSSVKVRPDELSAGAIPQDTVVTIDDRPAFRTLQAIRHRDDPVQEGTGIGLGRRLLFQQVPDAKLGKNRVHLDLVVDDLDQSTAEIEKLGGRWLEPGNTRELEGFRWRCMADPEGNEFDIDVLPGA